MKIKLFWLLCMLVLLSGCAQWITTSNEHVIDKYWEKKLDSCYKMIIERYWASPNEQVTSCFDLVRLYKKNQNLSDKKIIDMIDRRDYFS